MINVTEYFSKQSKSFLIALGFVLVVLLGFVDYLTGDLFPIFYLGPIILLSWYVGRRVGILISIASAITGFVVDEMTKSLYSSDIVPYWNVTTRLIIFLIMSYILSALKAAMDREKQLARTDLLTGLGNRRAFIELGYNEINKAHRYKRSFSVAYIDLDNFKMINDHLGHSTGDTLLQIVSNTIQNNIRVIDIAARLGGDEFAILLPETRYELAQVAIRRIQKSLLDIMQKNEWPVTFSIGMVTFIHTPSTVDEMIKLIDSLMYSVKNNGKNAIKHEVFDK